MCLNRYQPGVAIKIKDTAVFTPVGQDSGQWTEVVVGDEGQIKQVVAGTGQFKIKMLTGNAANFEFQLPKVSFELAPHEGYHTEWSGAVSSAGEYFGNQDRTVTGRLCAPWSQFPTSLGNFPVEVLGDGHHNYCRNPNDDTLPWCFVLEGFWVAKTATRNDWVTKEYCWPMNGTTTTTPAPPPPPTTIEETYSPPAETSGAADSQQVTKYALK